MLPSRLPRLSPLAFEMFYAHSAAHGIPETKKPCVVRIWSHRTKNKRDLFVRVRVEGTPDGFVMILACSKIYARTMDRHLKHLRMMHQLFTMMGHTASVKLPDLRLYEKQNRARALKQARSMTGKMSA